MSHVQMVLYLILYQFNSVNIQPPAPPNSILCNPNKEKITLRLQHLPNMVFDAKVAKDAIRPPNNLTAPARALANGVSVGHDTIDMNRLANSIRR